MKNFLVASALIAALLFATPIETPVGAAGPGDYSAPEWMPARGTRQVNCSYQNCSGGTYHDDYAIDIVMGSGDSVYASGAGRVADVVSDQGQNCSTAIYSSTNCPKGREGNYVIVSHSASGPPYSVYFHLSSVATGVTVGAWVDENTVLGGAGDSGWSDPGFVHIHYEERGTLIGTIGANPGTMRGCQNGQTASYPSAFGPGITNWGDETHSTHSMTNDGSCSETSADTDTDGVPDNDDLCPNTPAGTAVDTDGCPLGRTMDFDADGQDDLPVGAPGENSASGLVHVMFPYPGDNVGFRTSDPTILEESINQNVSGMSTPGNINEAGDVLGSSFAVGDFDGDGQDDLAIGAPGENGDSGMVHVLFARPGSNEGFVNSDGVAEETITQNIAGISTPGNVPEAGDRFGEVLVAGDFDGDGQDDLAIAAPGENGGSGMVHVLFARPGSNEGFITSDGAVEETITQNVPGISTTDNIPEAGDNFGAAMAVGDFDGNGQDDLAIGAPGENGQAGLLHVLFARPGDNIGFVTQEAVLEESINQNTTGVSSQSDLPEAGDLFASVLATGDFDGDGQDDLAVSATGENDRAGIVHVMFAKPGEFVGFANNDGVVEQTLSQNLPGVSTPTNLREPNDFFGAALAAGDFDADGQDDLAVGAPGENGGAGLLHVFFPRPGDNVGFLTNVEVAEESINQGTAGVSTVVNIPEAGDLFAATLAVGDFDDDGQDDLAAGAPGEDDRSGMLHVFFAKPGSNQGFADGNGTVEDTITQAVPGMSSDGNLPEPNDLFGAALPGSSCLSIVCDEPADPVAEGVRLLSAACSMSALGGGVTASSTETLDLPTTCGIPDEADAVLVSVWAVDPIATGNLRLGPAGNTSPLGIVNFGANTLNNTTTAWIPLSTTNQLELGANAGPVPDNTPLASSVELEILAWSGTSTAPNPLLLHPVTPCAFYDTRPNQNASSTGPAAVGTTQTAQLTGTFPTTQGGGNTTCGIPESAEAALVNYVTIQPTGQTTLIDPTTAATLVNNQPLTGPFNNASAVVAPINNGNITTTLQGDTAATAHIRMQVLGYYTPPSDPGGLTYNPITPCVAFDTRSTQNSAGTYTGPRTGGQTTTYQITGTFPADQGGGNTTCGIPTNAEAIEINVVGIQAQTLGNFVASATGTTPTGGIVNFGPLNPAMNNANAATIPINTTGQLNIYTNAGPQNTAQPIAHTRGTITGYYTPTN